MHRNSPSYNKEILDTEHYFTDSVKLTGFKKCQKDDDAVREYAASLMINSWKRKKGSRSTLMCYYDDLVFEPPLFVNSEFHRASIPYKEIIGFYVAPTYNTRLILVVKEGSSETIYLYGIQMSSPEKAKEISVLLGEARPPVQSVNTSGSASKTVVLEHNSEDVTPLVTNETPEYIDHNNNTKVLPEDTPATMRSEQYYNQWPGYDIENNPSESINNISRNTDRRMGSRLYSDSDVFDGHVTPFLPETSDQSKIISIGYYNDEDDINNLEEENVNNDEEETPNERNSPENAWVENITYISNTPNERGQITSNGSVYMYVAQQVNPRMN